jgi:ATP-binding cassette subfamily C (CFTR/MRP) protein 1
MDTNLTSDDIIIRETRPFCSTPLWDLNQTWYTNNPDFTPCFHKTILQYFPFLLLLLLSPYQFYACYKSRHRGIPISLICSTRVFLTTLLIVLELGVFAWFLANQLFEEKSDAVAPLVNFVAYSFACVLHILCVKYGLVTSGVLFTFWILKVILGAFTFRTVINFIPLSDETDYVPSVCYIIEYTLICGVFFLNCWAESRPTHPHLEGKLNCAVLLL